MNAKNFRCAITKTSKKWRRTTQTKLACRNQNFPTSTPRLTTSSSRCYPASKQCPTDTCTKLNARDIESELFLADAKPTHSAAYRAVKKDMSFRKKRLARCCWNKPSSLLRPVGQQEHCLRQRGTVFYAVASTIRKETLLQTERSTWYHAWTSVCILLAKSQTSQR